MQQVDEVVGVVHVLPDLRDAVDQGWEPGRHGVDGLGAVVLLAHVVGGRAWVIVGCGIVWHGGRLYPAIRCGDCHTSTQSAMLEALYVYGTCAACVLSSIVGLIRHWI